MLLSLAYPTLTVKLKDSNYCFNSLAIRIWPKDLKHLIPGNRLPDLNG